MSIFKRKAKSANSEKILQKETVQIPQDDNTLLQGVANLREDDDILDARALAAIDKRLAENRKAGRTRNKSESSRKSDVLHNENRVNLDTDLEIIKELQALRKTDSLGIPLHKPEDIDDIPPGDFKDLEVPEEIEGTDVSTLTSSLESREDSLASAPLDTAPRDATGRTDESQAEPAPTLAAFEALKNPPLRNIDPVGDQKKDITDQIAAASLEPQDLPGTNLGELRLDIAKISSDIENGEALYRRAQSRVESLLGFAEKAEVNFSLLNRLEPENRRLKAQNFSIKKDLDDSTQKISVLDADLKDHKQRLLESTADLTHANGQLSQALARINAYENKFNNVRQERDALEMRVDREKTSYEVEARENRVLREKISQLSANFEDAMAEKMNLAKIIESLKIDCADESNAKESLEKENSDMRLALETTRTQNNEMKGQVSSVHEEIKTFKTQYEYNILSRDDRIFALEAQLEDLNKQLAIKDEIVSSASQDLALLRKTRTASDLERERLERTIEGQSYQLHAAEEQLLRSKQNMDLMDKRYKETAAALAIAHQRRQVHTPAAAPDIHPHMSAPQHPPLQPPPLHAGAAQPKTQQYAPLQPLAPPPAAHQGQAPTPTPKPVVDQDIMSGDSADENLSNQIMQYKLGERSKIS